MIKIKIISLIVFILGIYEIFYAIFNWQKYNREHDYFNTDSFRKNIKMKDRQIKADLIQGIASVLIALFLWFCIAS